MENLYGNDTNFNYNYNAKISNIRFYNRSLSEPEINQIIKTDKKSPTLYRKGHPIDFSLLDKDKNSVLYISDDPSEQHILSLELKNSSTQAIQFIQDKEKGDRASNNNHHFALIFPSGTLSDQTRQAIKVENSGEWDVAISEEHTKKQRVSLYFLYKGANTLLLAPEETRRITLCNMSAAAGSGARGTHVELKLNQLAYFTDNAQGTTAPPLITGYRLQKLHIANHVGRKNIPLHVGFVGSNRILNDGQSASELTLRITNISKEAISLEGARFILSFDVDDDKSKNVNTESKEWAIATLDKLQAIKIETNTNTKVEISNAASGQAISPEWIINQNIKLEPKGYIDITISNIASNKPSGYTNLYIRYENIPGYWDGQFVCAIEKAPLLFSGNHVGIGTTKPIAKLDIMQTKRTVSHPESVKGLYVTGDFNESDGVEFRRTDGKQGIGFGYNTIYAAGSDSNQDLKFKAKGSGKLIIESTLQCNGQATFNEGLKVGNYQLNVLSLTFLEMLILKEDILGKLRSSIGYTEPEVAVPTMGSLPKEAKNKLIVAYKLIDKMLIRMEDLQELEELLSNLEAAQSLYKRIGDSYTTKYVPNPNELNEIANNIYEKVQNIYREYKYNVIEN